ncbi:cation transporter [Grimontia hollisae]|nr:cation transporter [Grimontia hollisae]AMG29392.1 cation transporter [Grimontia hollisae]MDF2184029.1 cation transporter [Grimontia hollisae]STO77593.1 Predicted Co/Zn/Cd cation transporters [Grimontia hollisae]STO98554.1 Predicted Co/Zn/Cd cation transporters [Grimontia hollisae]STQ75619.1 Predicted Co/Zn/Cd cation transporters [Grimontia hollisae]
MSCEYTKERNLLKFSTFACFCFAALGIGLGIWAGSMVIVFDGAYSLVGLVLSLMALAASMYIHKPVEKANKKVKSVSERKAAVIESLVVLTKGLVVGVVCLVSFASAMQAMFDGGREVNAGFALVFGIINVVGCLVTYMTVRKQSGKRPSAILKAESSQWLMDTVISAAVLVGFLIAAGLMMTGLEEYAVYADPMMVILASVYFATVPVQMISESTKKLIAVHQASIREKGEGIFA